MLVPSPAGDVEARLETFVNSQADTSYWTLIGLNRKEFFGRATKKGFVLMRGIWWSRNTYRPFARIKTLPHGSQARVDIVVFTPGILLMLLSVLAFLIFGFKSGQWMALWGVPVAIFGVHLACWIAYLFEKRTLLRKVSEILAQTAPAAHG